jgi:hypothetical protein
MTTITASYCFICEKIDLALNKFVNVCETAGTARAASQLSAMGYHEEAKALMLSIGEETK